ncbi:MAG: hypothetical protein JWN34_6164 [Bryobacterales bacterium]|nr:hypothetical protein [Bryobacterales bacterium]
MDADAQTAIVAGPPGLLARIRGRTPDGDLSPRNTTEPTPHASLMDEMLWKLVALLLVTWLVLLTAKIRLGGWSHALFLAVILLGVFEIMRGRRPAG